VQVLALEYITGGGLAGEDLPGSLAREGDLMLRTLLGELDALPGVTALSTRDPRLAAPDGGEFIAVAPGADPWDLWERAADGADALWPIAPETGGALERLSRIATRRGKILLGSSPEAVAIAGSKRATFELLARHGIPAVETRAAGSGLPETDSEWVAKPDDGAGAEQIWVFADRRALSDWLARKEHSSYVVQPYLPGEAASLSVLFRDGECSVLSCNRQDVGRTAGAFRYRGFSVGAREDARAGLEDIAGKIARALPGLFGYAGIDVVMTGRGPVVLEINPRLTTSYAGLGAALGKNVAELVLGLAAGGPMLELRPQRTVHVAVEDADG